MSIEGTCEKCGLTTYDYGCLNCITAERDDLMIRCRGFQLMARRMVDIVASGVLTTDLEQGR